MVYYVYVFANVPGLPKVLLPAKVTWVKINVWLYLHSTVHAVITSQSIRKIQKVGFSGIAIFYTVTVTDLIRFTEEGK